MDSKITISYEEYLDYLNCKTKLMLIKDYAKSCCSYKSNYTPLEEAVVEICELNQTQ